MGEAQADVATAKAASAISDEEVSALLEKGGSETLSSGEPLRPGEHARLRDFIAPRINRTRLPMLEILSRTFAGHMGSSLSSLLGREASVEFTALDSAKTGEIQAALPVPGSLAIVRLKPLPGLAFVSVEPSLLLALLDGYFGGSGRIAGDSQAVTGPTAQRFLVLLLRSFAADLSVAWAPVTPLELELVKQETNPSLLNLGDPLGSILAVRFTVEFAAHSGRMDWLLPETLVAPIRETLGSEGGGTPVRNSENWAPALCTALQEAELEARAILAQAQISLRELVCLAPGDIVPIDAPQYVTLLAGEVPLYRGRFGVSQGRNSLKILPRGGT